MHGMSLSDENLILDCPVVSDAAPVVVGGIGGSGTRVIAQLLKDWGFDMGSDLNESLDDLGFTALFKRPSLWPIHQHVPQLQEALSLYLTARGQPPAGTALGDKHKLKVETVLNSIQKEQAWIESGHLQERRQPLQTIDERTNPSWGWKEPNTHLFLRYLLSAIPNLRYLHVVRHGLDMALSNNQTQLTVWGSRILDRPVDVNSPHDSLAFWVAVHQSILRAQTEFPDKVKIVRFESLFEHETAALAEIQTFLKIRAMPTAVCKNVPSLQKPDSINRYKSAPKFSISASAEYLLKTLGYSVGGGNL
jgi:hypothetical protein